MSREFDLSDILSITTGCLVSTRHVAGVYDILNFMTGDDLFTHALPRASQACEGPLLDQHSQLASVRVPSWDRAGDVAMEVAAWVTEMKAKFGNTLPVTPLAEWHHIDPIQELVELTERPDRVTAVVVSEATPSDSERG